MQSQAFFYIFFFSFHLYIIYAHISEPNENNSFLNEMNENEDDHKTASFHKHFTFFPGRPRWNKTKLRYAFNKLTRPETIPPIERAIRTWAAVTPFKFIKVNNFTAAGSDIRISFVPGLHLHGDGSPFPDNGLAHTFAPPDGRIHFNKDISWDARVHFEAGVNGSFSGAFYDLQTVAVHALGHALGLGHSGIKEAVMYATIVPEERKGLHKDDVQGIEALYK